MVITDDHYVLDMFRIRQHNLPAHAPVVFLQHGLMDCADTWIDNDPSVAAAFQLARAGYDIFLGNNRGNVYSNVNLNLDPEKDDKAFHDYSFVKYGQFDLPAQIKKAIDIAKPTSGKVTYMGHSEGTSQMFYALSSNQTWIKDHVNLFVALAPIARLTHANMFNIHTIA